MKLSDYVAAFVEKKGINEAFVLSGGCIVHMIDSISNRKKIKYIPVLHEQAGAMAADAYARVTGNYGLVLSTSGPGATNLLTGICCSYYDSIPVIAITGQVPTSQLKKNIKSRQIGFQETDVVSIYRSVTKYVKLIDNPNEIRYELEKAFYIAKEGRPGPVLLDICDDIQRAEINPSNLRGFKPKLKRNKPSTFNFLRFKKIIENAERPIFIFGAGIRLSGSLNLLKKIIKKIRIPYTLTWGAMDYFDGDEKLFTGGFGVTSGRAGNFAVQNSDLVIAIGTRLDTHEVGSKISTFAREAKKIIVDIDPGEQKKYKKFGMNVDMLLSMDCSDFLEILNKNNFNINKLKLSSWIKQITEWKLKYPTCSKSDREQKYLVNPYFFMEILSKNLESNHIIVTDTGSNLIWTMQALRVKKSQRVISAWNHSPMGYSIPAAIGAAFANPKAKIICISGDAGAQINIQELATIKKHNLNISIFILNNHCQGIIQGTQQNWLSSKYHASDPEFGKLPDPDIHKIGKAYEISSFKINNNRNLELNIKKCLNSNVPTLCDVNMEKKSQIYPKLLYGRPIEDSDPLLERNIFYDEMIVKPIT